MPTPNPKGLDFSDDGLQRNRLHLKAVPPPTRFYQMKRPYAIPSKSAKAREILVSHRSTWWAVRAILVKHTHEQMVFQQSLKIWYHAKQGPCYDPSISDHTHDFISHSS